MIEGLYIIL